jgi:hypothetical protein
VANCRRRRVRFGGGPTRPPTDIEVARLLAAVRGRIIRLLRGHDIDLERAASTTSAATH